MDSGAARLLSVILSSHQLVMPRCGGRVREQWRNNVLGYDVNPIYVVDYGSKRLHTIGHRGVRFYDELSQIP